jgi:Nickel responsive protein SCO4226-like
MTTPRRSDPDSPSSVFLVERYLPAAAAGSLASSVSRAAQLCTLSAESGSASRVQYLHSVYLPAEDTCFCLFRAATAEAVDALNDEAGFALDRIAAAVQLYPVNPVPDET